MEGLTLIHTKDDFKLKIGDKEIPYVTGYCITSNGKDHGVVDLTLQTTLAVDEIEIGVKQCNLH